MAARMDDGGIPLLRKGPVRVPIAAIEVDPQQMMTMLLKLCGQVEALYQLTMRTTPCVDCGKVWDSAVRCGTCSEAFAALPAEEQQLRASTPVAGGEPE